MAKKVTPTALEALGKALVNDKFWGVQAEIAKAIGSVKSESALDELLKGLEIESSRARTSVARALGNFYENDRAFEALEKLVKDTDSYFVVSAAAASMGLTKHTRAVEVLKNGLQDAYSSWTEIVIRGYLAGLAATEKEEVIDRKTVEGIREEVEVIAKETIDEWKSFPWYKKVFKIIC